MKRSFFKTIYLCASLVLFFNTAISHASPWFTGPLLGASGHTSAKGQANVELNSFNTIVDGVYDSKGHFTETQGEAAYSSNISVTYGLTKKLDLQAITGYVFKTNKGAHSEEMNNSVLGFGYQLLEQKESPWLPDIRFAVLEILPTGPFDHLNLAKNGTDSSGLGSFETSLGLNFQRVRIFKNDMSLRTRVSLAYFIAQDVHIEGVSSYGGTPLTNGVVNPGNLILGDIATELHLTKYWVAVMEINATQRDKSIFSGNPGVEAEDDFDVIGGEVGKQISLAPAIEYNFSSHIGIIAGVWFPVFGRNTAKYNSYVIAIDAVL